MKAEFIKRLKTLSFKQLVEMYGGMCSRSIPEEAYVLPYLENEILGRYDLMKEKTNEI